VSPRSRIQVNRRKRGNYRKNHGQPGVVYILANPGLRDGWWKIGCSTRSGAQRARELNIDATTGTPGIFECIFEHRTLNCGLAEERVFATLAESRKGKWGQEYFAVEVQIAKETIRRVCHQVDDESAPPAPAPLPPPPTTPSPAPHPIQPTPPEQVSQRPQQHKPTPTVAISVPAPGRSNYPERFCGYCRTLVMPATRFLLLKYCPKCGNAL
jgi:hypothetical protein